MGDIIVISVLALVVTLVIVSQIRKKKGGSCAGCNGCCAHCTACPGKESQ